MADVPARGNILRNIIPARYIFAILCSIGMAIIYGLKVNLSVAMPVMVNNTAIGINKIHKAQCGLRVEEEKRDGPFIWNKKIQGYIISSYFWGYLLSMFPSGRLAELFSGKLMFTIAVASNAIGTILTPLAAKIHYGIVILLRVIEGVGAGVTFPTSSVMLASWAPLSERAFMSSLVMAGTSLGNVISIYLTGLLENKLGWESVFYIMGALSLIWLVLWIWLVTDAPDVQPYITTEEREYIMTTAGVSTRSGKKPKLPWISLFNSIPFWALCVTHTCSNWAWYMLLFVIPFYYSDVVNLTIHESSIYLSVSYLTLWLCTLILSSILDTLRKKKIINLTSARKIATLYASVPAILCHIGLCFVDCNKILSIALITIAITTMGGMFAGFLSNHVDIAPPFAGTLMGLTNTPGTVSGIVAPIFYGHITHTKDPSTAWQTIFAVSSVFLCVEAVVFTLFGSGEEQEWSKQARADAAAN